MKEIKQNSPRAWLLAARPKTLTGAIIPVLIGGDLHEGCEYVQPLLAALSGVKTPMGTYVVLGNNDYEACYDDIVRKRLP